MIDIIHVGMGPLGQMMVLHALDRKCFNIVGAVGEPTSYEQIKIDGRPPVHSRMVGGIHGDVATCAITLNCIGSVLKSAPPQDHGRHPGGRLL